MNLVGSSCWRPPVAVAAVVQRCLLGRKLAGRDRDTDGARPGEELEPDIVGDHYRYLKGRWYPHG